MREAEEPISVGVELEVVAVRRDGGMVQRFERHGLALEQLERLPALHVPEAEHLQRDVVAVLGRRPVRGPEAPRSESLPDDVRADSFVCHRLVDGEDAVVAPDLVPGRAMPRRAGDAGPIAAPSSPNERRHEVRRRPSRGRHDGCRVARCGFCFFDVNSEGMFHTGGRHAVRPARGARRGGARRAPQVPAQAQTRARADTPFPGNPPGPDEPRGGRLPSPDVGPDDDDE